MQESEASSPPSERDDARRQPDGWVWTWGPALVAMAVIYIASSVPDLGALPGDMSDKTAHFVGYAVLGALVLRGTSRARWDGVSVRSALVAWGISAAYGASDELHQWFVPGRTPALDDWWADTSGAAIAIGLLTLAAYGLRRETRAV